ncbi:hypothetical protein [Acidovorax sp. A1169]|uniref:hypothetical protein n=1 Tax=Acidovorax sp. A1169 TaxID=3059524 RepID=UPI002737B7DE|nr:hypothetical protein [Acidovorax sp. A1169]MDP4074224.1 hypothetical protein [Acidovorax sp. A1169]
MSTTPQHSSTTAATDVAEFITDLDGGQFDRMLSIALSQVAAGTVDNDAKGEVNIKFVFEKIPGSSQVLCKHILKFSRPTINGRASEEASRKTALHVGKFGRLTLAPESQLAMFDRSGTPMPPSAPQPSTTQGNPSA